jgi:exosortase/archaeosortase family protein
VRFCALYGCLVALLLILEGTPFSRLVISATAQLTAMTLGVLGTVATARGSMVISPDGSLDIIYECTPVYASALLVSGICAFPTAWKKRLGGAVAGIALMVAVNHLRVVSLFYVAGFLPERFEVAHLVVWPCLLVVVTLTAWLTWAVRR